MKIALGQSSYVSFYVSKRNLGDMPPSDFIPLTKLSLTRGQYSMILKTG